jgi:hypothetical protein
MKNKKIMHNLYVFEWNGLSHRQRQRQRRRADHIILERERWMYINKTGGEGIQQNWMMNNIINNV